MAEELIIHERWSREEKYRALLPQMEALTEGETDVTANMANVAAALKQAFGFFWVGFYVVKEGVLTLGPFQGAVACTRIGYGKGVCGTAWKEGRTVIVPDVERFAGHIACSSASRSEIVVPIRDGEGTIVAVLDVDSDSLDDFGAVDALYLEKAGGLLYPGRVCP
ncbi:MAG: GAF domain-containing protein [Tannerellaceae bacterium]|jgi:GAF domain-containing protein|nr:GAF domain-containing protein [Tannerellaceae bacterium]